MKSKEQLKQLNDKSLKELTKELDESYKKLRELKFSKTFRKLKNTNLIKQARANIARIWTVIGLKVDIKAEEK